MALPIPTTLHALKLDAATINRAGALVTVVQNAYDSYRSLNTGAPSETITILDVYTNACQIGLNRWIARQYWQTPPSHYQPTVASFTPHSGTGVVSTNVPVWTQTVTAATALAAALGGGPTVDNILGCAVCTGIAAMASIDQQVGPFS